MKVSMGGGIVPALLVVDMEKTLAFYRRIGFGVSDAFAEAGSSAAWAQVKRDGVVLQFHTQAPHGTPPAPVCSGTFYVAVSDVDALADELKGVVDFEWGVEVMPYGQKEFGLKDPNGYYLAFAQKEEEEE